VCVINPWIGVDWVHILSIYNNCACLYFRLQANFGCHEVTRSSGSPRYRGRYNRHVAFMCV